MIPGDRILEEAAYLKRKIRLLGPTSIATLRASCRYRWNMPRLSLVSYKTLARIFMTGGFPLVREEGGHMVSRERYFELPDQS